MKPSLNDLVNKRIENTCKALKKMMFREPIKLTFKILQEQAKARGKTPHSVFIEKERKDGGRYTLVNNDTGIETSGLKTLDEVWTELYYIDVDLSPLFQLPCTASTLDQEWLKTMLAAEIIEIDSANDIARLSCEGKRVALVESRKLQK